MNPFARAIVLGTVWAAFALGRPALAGLSVCGLPATNVTASNAWLVGAVLDTNALNPDVYVFWGAADCGATNAGWDATNQVGTNPVGGFSLQVSDLLPGTIYYYRPYAVTTSEEAWASSPMAFRTIPIPSNLPAPSAHALAADTNGVLIWPTNGGLFLPDNVGTSLQDRLVAAESASGISGVAATFVKGSSNSVGVSDGTNIHVVFSTNLEGSAACLGDYSAAQLIQTGQTYAVQVGEGCSNFTKAAWAYASNAVAPYQAWTGSLTPDEGGTCLVTYAHGALVRIDDPLTNITLAFDLASYNAVGTGGVARVAVMIYALTNSVALDFASCTNEASATKSTNGWTRWLFLRVSDELFKGRQ